MPTLALAAEQEVGNLLLLSLKLEGKSCFIPTDIEENKYQRSLLVRLMNHHGLFQKHFTYLNLFSGTQMYRSLEIFNDYCEMVGATVLPLSFHCSDDYAYKIVAEFKGSSNLFRSHQPSRCIDGKSNKTSPISSLHQFEPEGSS